MRVLNLCKDDWANFAHDNARALRAAGVDVTDVKLNRHLFGYEEESTVLPQGKIQAMILNQDFDYIQVFHSDLTFIGALRRTRARVVVYHAGSYYRDEHAGLNAAWNPLAHRSVLALGEFWNLGAANRVYAVGAIDTAAAPDLTHQGRPYLFGHFPSNPAIKGTERIVKLMRALQGPSTVSQFRHSFRPTNHAEQVRRLAGVDVCVELLQPELNGNRYGSWGITALEAAAIGKVVVTMSLSREVYEAHYGDCPLVLATDDASFCQAIVSLQYLTNDALLDLKRKTRDWVVRNHSLEATGQYLLKNVLT